MKTTIIIIASFSFFTKGYSQWNVNPAINTPICTAQNKQRSVDMAADTKGGAIIAWVDDRVDSAHSSIYVQRINSAGYTLWTSNGILACADTNNQANMSIKEDGAGGVLLAWADKRNGDRDIYAQRVDSMGNLLWGAGGIAVVVKPLDQRSPKLISDGSGGALIVWQDSVALDWNIYAQRVNNAGTTMWNAGGVPICTATQLQIGPRIEPDGAGGAIMVWQDKRNGVDYDIYSQRVNSSGVVQWAANGVFVCSTLGSQKSPKLKSDFAGGAIIAWQDGRFNGTDNSGIYAQRVNASGVMLWATNGIPVCTAIGSQSRIDMTNEGISGVIITWRDMRNDPLGTFWDIYAQKVNLNGTVAWAPDGVPVTTANYSQQNASICGDGVGGGIIAWEDSVNGNWDIYSQRVNASGVVQWAANGVPVGTAPNDQTGVMNISDGTGGSIYAWQDGRAGFNNDDIYAHHLYPNGTTDGIIEEEFLIESRIFPNPFNSEATIILSSSINNAYGIKLYDIYGREIRINVTRTSHGFIIQRNATSRVLGGMYFYNIMDGNTIISKGKFIITD